ncbi:hypothetical protein [Mucilaginibacter sp.]|uniref:hypothetical protein n=1 Tax=Mucilaginibacter sp. TaxID=1882438 RepID=UPI002B9458B8|nr:hypothetical protein [Mucilaginibacter sp.]HTI57447.1 hypothetical protein [Mucilaginibacter sp.]
MKLKLLVILVCPAVIYSSCSNHVYAPALYHQDIAYMPKPASFSKEKIANYASAGLNVYSDPTYINSQVSAQLNYSQGFKSDNANFAWGVFGVAGNYERSSDSNEPNPDFKDKFFGAYGARLSANLLAKYDNLDWRYLGFEAAYSHEFGAYADFRKQVVNNADYVVDARTDLFTIGLTTEFVFHGQDPEIVHGLRGFLGTSFGKNILNDPRYDSDTDFNTRLFRSLVPRASYFINVKRFFAVAEVGNAFFIRAGVKF